MRKADIESSNALITVEIIEYEPHSVISKTIINKTTGKVNIMSFDIGENLTEQVIPFDAYAQIIDGKAEIIINDISYILGIGQSIIIPAHTPTAVKANERFKMILTIIKSGYE